MSKANPNWQDEARVPAGNPGGGRWTGDGNADSDVDEEGSGTPTDVAYQGTYHDKVVAELAAQWRSKGVKVSPLWL